MDARIPLLHSAADFVSASDIQAKAIASDAVSLSWRHTAPGSSVPQCQYTYTVKWRVKGISTDLGEQNVGCAKSQLSHTP
ncbi:unnamed protein product [Protopolystoma xenopodis]|uniref:Uncharacterized protein n=1 Tax=Protopolystoma xenopodis TaxID=117903 RepID=A0A448XRU5_9PLAT|nr:unnamed protein product [Protopolystoma xenopodis]